MNPTPGQILQALENTIRRPINRSPEIYAALRNEKTAFGGRFSQIIGQMTSQERQDEG